MLFRTTESRRSCGRIKSIIFILVIIFILIFILIIIIILIEHFFAQVLHTCTSPCLHKCCTHAHHHACTSVAHMCKHNDAQVSLRKYCLVYENW